MDREQAAGLIITAVILLPLLIAGIALCLGHGADLIAGYNTASPEEKAKWDEKALCRGVGALVLLILACIAVTAAGGVFEKPLLLWLGLGSTAAVTAGGLVYLNKSKRFKRK